MWENPEEAFKELDEKEFAPIASTLSALLKCLKEEGFSHDEAFDLTKNFSKLLFDLTFEDYVNQKRLEEEEEMMAEDGEFHFEYDPDTDYEDEDDDVDSDEDDQ